jgi:hypothetical protein
MIFPLILAKSSVLYMSNLLFKRKFSVWPWNVEAIWAQQWTRNIETILPQFVYDLT